ncbi:hypothetical protein ANOM_005085 [Aspergillus nomiae NRRL 13137]|uniref:Uncharacterized protein n=1 Tax=Aspergillus nomiae NRRL (strain ATCC 15546 / NRRL 13137 / CBS 260.88 / M93) TaxID=1509407 RepID=A0A0L1J2V0_ASPN3|nr:uncharacterized protein ANOM_005085 [Aspergillus nomiae NRRL 13137]KNG85980.1 hypothetical protein ANOM_005085 [Aspergillus nomiae NRRL 13137]
MGDAYEREQYDTLLSTISGAAQEMQLQNNALLNSLSSKVSALKSVTIDIHDNARDQDTLDHSNQVFSSLSTSLTGSASRLTRMARQGDTVAVLKVAGIVIAIGLALWVILGWIF